MHELADGVVLDDLLAKVFLSKRGRYRAVHKAIVGDDVVAML